MALSDKNIVITPNIGSSSDPKIVFSGADASTGAQNITLQVYPTNSGTLSFEGSVGQLFSISNTMTGTIFSANDVSGIPSIEVLDNGLVKLAQYSGNVVLGTGLDNSSDKLQVTGSIKSTTNITAAGQLISTVSTGTAPLVVSSSTVVNNLNAQYWNGNTFSNYLNQAVLTSSSPSFSGLTINGSTAQHRGNVNYNTWDTWLRENGDDGQFQMYGNTRTMIYRTDGNTNAHGGGSYAHIFYYGGSSDNQRVFIINTDGRLYSPYHGWLDGMSTTGNAGSVSGLTLTSSSNGINPDNVTQNQLGYNTNISLFGQTDGGLYSSAYSSSWIHQIYGDFRTGQIAIRGKNSGTWQSWRTVIDSSNYASYVPSVGKTLTIAR